jgi:uncharacterized protein YaaQ
MELVKSINFITDAINYSKGYAKKYVTNYFISSEKAFELIISEKLFYIKVNEVIFLFKKNDNFYNLYFFASSIDSLTIGLDQINEILNLNDVIVDIVSKDNIADVVEVFKQKGFNNYTTLRRMSRTGMSNPVVLQDTNLMIANHKDLDQIFDLLHENFDIRAEQIPSREEVSNWIKKDSVLVYKLNNEVTGFIIFDLNGLTLYLRYWFVSENHRNKKIGSKLFNFFLDMGKDKQNKSAQILCKSKQRFGSEELVIDFIDVSEKSGILDYYFYYSFCPF